MAEQQLVDYIKKAKEAKQSDDQTRAILYKSGWTEAEVADAFTALNPQPTQPQPQPQPQAVIQPKVEEKPEIQPQIQAQVQPEVKAQPQPQIQQQQSSPVDEQSVMPKPKSHLLMKLVMVFIIVVVLGCVGYIVAGQYFNLPYSSILLDFFAPKPEAVISKMVANMKNVKSSRTVMIAEISVADNNKTPQGKLSFRTEGDSDTTDTANPKGSFSIKFDITSAGSAVPTASVNANLIAVDGVSYVKISDFTVPDPSSGPDISQIKGKWLKIDKDSITALTALSAEQGMQMGVSDLSQINSAEFTKKIQDLFLAENLISFDKQLSDETIEGQNAHHYMVKISKEKVGELTTKIIQEAQQATPDMSSPLVQNMIQAFVKTFIDALGDINIEMWIGKKDQMLYKFAVDKTIDLSSALPGAVLQANIKFNSTSSNFNQPISVTAPADTQKIEDVISPMLVGSTAKAAVELDLRRLAAWANSISRINSSYSSLCASGLLNGYQKDLGEDLIGIHNDIVSQGAEKPKCFASSDNFCVSTKIDSQFICAGTKPGAIGSIKCESAGTVCE